MLKSASRARLFDVVAHRVPRGTRRPADWAREGERCVEREDLIGALRCFQRALEDDIDCAAAWIGLSDVFTRMNDRERSGACLQVAKMIERRAETPVATA